MNESKHSLNTDKALFDRPEVMKWSLRLFYSICILLVAVDFIIHRHIETDIEKIPAFYVIYAFLACVFFVLIANQLQKLIMRDENFYKNAQVNNKKDNK
jgi:hypothetical protein